MPSSVTPRRYAAMTMKSSAFSPRTCYSALLSVDDICLHGEVLGQSQTIQLRSRSLVARFDALPELPLIIAPREGSGVLLGLMLEDRLDLEAELLLGQRNQERRLMNRPLLPRAAIE